MTLQATLGCVSDFRSKDGNFRHLLIDILVLCVIGTLCGSEDYEDISFYGREHEDFLKVFLSLPHGIPSHDTLNRVMSGIDSQQFHKCFMEWVRHIANGAYEQVSIDGKRLGVIVRRILYTW